MKAWDGKAYLMFEPKSDVANRYKFDPSPHLPHMKIVERAGKNKKVLDVGCATGYLAKQLKQNGCYVVGMEIDEEAAKTAKRYCDSVIIGDIEQIAELSYPIGFFDIIVYSDILEHLRRPDLILMNFKRYLARDGYVIASIPNIGRFEIRAKLLFGKFEYEDTGYLDKTHLRFFTLKTAKQLLERSGYVVEQVDYTGIASKIRILRLFPTLFACQFIIIASPQSRTRNDFTV